MRAYYFDNLPGDQKLPHDYNPSRPVDTGTLSAIGVQHWTIRVQGYETLLDDVAKERKYRSRDVVHHTREKLGEAFEEKMAAFYKEHMHEDEEIRYILEGSGFFDVREAPNDSWIRIAVVPGDLLVVPAGIYHRFTLDEREKIKTVRLFKDLPKWEALPRGAETDQHPLRLGYLQSIALKA